MSFASINGLTVHYRFDRSPDQPVLVFINSLGTDMRIWDEMLPDLSRHYAILRFDKRGHGLTDAPPGPYTISSFADDLAALLDHLHVSKILLVGISIGGMIALDFAARYSDRLSVLVISDSGLKIGTAEMWRQRMKNINEQGMPQLARTILERWFAHDFPQREPVLYQGYINMFSRMPADGYNASCEALAEGDVHALAASITVPTLVTVGVDDSATPSPMSQELAAALPQATYVEIDGSGHLPCIEQPARMAEILMTFFSEQGYG